MEEELLLKRKYLGISSSKVRQQLDVGTLPSLSAQQHWACVIESVSEPVHIPHPALPCKLTAKASKLANTINTILGTSIVNIPDYVAYVNKYPIMLL